MFRARFAFCLIGEQGKTPHNWPGYSAALQKFKKIVDLLFVNIYNRLKRGVMKQKFLFDEKRNVFDSNGNVVGKLCLCVETKNEIVKLENQSQFLIKIKL